ncbi:hypothetical protein ABW11_21055 [Pluralibacter gergoviae]|uniref:hypothetical protein n=1 Tax=Pluralibacter gergoviae TaxID=61647 RepID=UPI00065129AA|nr:hypothetical protein [Pluralibacter gergoviae]KMK23102.1 hypothetical protein ABW11_21055 [Pluralibacter gergoviae]
MTKRVISTGGYPVEVLESGDLPAPPEPADITSEQITDASDIGKQILTAKDAAAVKALLGIT